MSTMLCATLLAVAFGGPPSHHGAPAYGFAAPVTYGYGAPVYNDAYGYPAYGQYAATVTPCPIAAGDAAGGYAASPPSPMAHRTAYGPTGERAASGPAAIVQMTDRARFEPALVTINVGQTVEWRSASRHAHTVTLSPDLAKRPEHVVLPEGAKPFDSGEIRPGGRFSHTFDVPGTYYYVCLPHEERGMVGIVVVQPLDEGRVQPGREQSAPAPGGAGRGY